METHSRQAIKFLPIPRSASRSLTNAGLAWDADTEPHPSLDKLPPIEDVNVVLKDPVKWYISFWAKSRTQGALLDWGLGYDDIEADLYKLLSFDKPCPETIVVKDSCSGWLEKDSQAVYANEYVKNGLGFYTFCVHKMCAYGRLPTKLNVVRIEELTTTPSNMMNTANVVLSEPLRELIYEKDRLMVQSYQDRVIYY